MSSLKSSSNSLLTRQPFKIIYTTFMITTLPIRLIILILYFIPKGLRQHPKWTFHQALGNAVFSVYWSYCTSVKSHTSKTLKPGAEKDRFVIIDPPSESKTSPYHGIVVRNPIIRPATIGGVWYKLAPKTGQVPRLVIIHFHGGAYVLGGARQMESGWGPEILSKALGCPVLQPQYRLASERNSYFPAALQDGITAYSYVLNVLKVKPQNVVLSGESAGGNIVLAMLRYFSEESGALPLPRAALIWSPWVDLVINADFNKHRNYKTDYILDDLVVWGARSHTPPDWSSGHPYISPLNNEFYTKVPMFLQTGTAEVLYDDHKRFGENMRKKGNTVEYVEITDAPHDTFGAGFILGFAKEAIDAADKAANFVKRVEGL